MIRGRVIIPRITVVILNCSNIIKPISNNVAKNIRAFLTEISPRAIGRVRVRSTCLSISRSQISFTTQPAPRIITAPKAKRVVMYNVRISIF